MKQSGMTEKGTLFSGNSLKGHVYAENGERLDIFLPVPCGKKRIFNRKGRKGQFQAVYGSA